MYKYFTDKYYDPYDSYDAMYWRGNDTSAEVYSDMLGKWRTSAFSNVKELSDDEHLSEITADELPWKE